MLRTRYRFLLLVLVLLFGAQTAFCAAKVSTPTTKELYDALDREDTPAYTQDQALIYVREMIPYVEQATGRKLKNVPMCKLVKRAQVEAVLTEELIPQLKQLMPKTSSSNVKYSAQQSASMYSMILIAKYGTKNKVLYLLPRNFQPLMNIAGVDPKYNQDILKLFIAHELAHAVQDQEVNLTKLMCSVKSVDQSMAINAVIEGQAMFVQDRVAELLKCDKAEKEVARFMSLEGIKGLDPSDSALTKRYTKQLEYTYNTGKDFIAWHANQGGTERVWQILASPPTNTTVIFHPERYSEKPVKSVDYAPVLKGVESCFGGKKWTVSTNSEIGELQARSSYASLEDADVAQIFDNLEHIQYMVAYSGNSTVVLELLVFNSCASPSTLVSSAEKANVNFAEQMKTRKRVTVIPPVCADIANTGADKARRISYTTKGKGWSIKDCFILASKGKVAVNVQCQDTDLTDKQVAALLGKLFSRVPQDLLSAK